MEGFVNENYGEEPVCLKCGEGIANVSIWAPGAVALVAFKPSGDLAWAGLTPEAAWPVQGRRARQSEQLGSWRCGLSGVQAKWRFSLSWSDS